MEVILLERIGKLGQMGDVVRVKDGFARNFLLPRGKALRATADNKKRFEDMKAELQSQEPRAQRRGRHACQPSSTARTIVVLRQASESGQLFGSVSTRDIAGLLKADGAEVNRSQIVLNAPIKTIGQYKVPLALHPEVEVSITVTVARSADEAQRIARGEDVTVRRTEAEEDAAAAAAAAEAMFDPEAKTQQRRTRRQAASPDTKSEEAPAKPAKAAKAEGKEENRREGLTLFRFFSVLGRFGVTGRGRICFGVTRFRFRR